MTWDIFVNPDVIKDAERATANLLAPPETARKTREGTPQEGAEWWENFKIISTTAGPFVKDGRTLATFDIVAQVDASSSTDTTNAGRIMNLRYFLQQDALSDKSHPDHQRNTRSYASIQSLLKACGHEPTAESGLAQFFLHEDKPLVGKCVTGKVREYIDRNGTRRQGVDKWLPNE